jgi:hypothetical protein
MKVAVEIAGVVVALIGAVVSWYFAWRAQQRAGRAEEAADNAQKREERAERRDKERLERERQAAERRSRADLVVNLAGSRGQRFGVIELKFHIRNVGEAMARDVRLQLLDKDATVVSSPGRAREVLTLAAGEISALLTRNVTYVGDEMGKDALPPGLASHVTWRDDSGFQQRKEPVYLSIDDIEFE